MNVLAQCHEQAAGCVPVTRPCVPACCVHHSALHPLPRMPACPARCLQAKTVSAASMKERDALYTELHFLGAAFRAKHDKLQEQVGKPSATG